MSFVQTRPLLNCKTNVCRGVATYTWHPGLGITIDNILQLQ